MRITFAPVIRQLSEVQTLLEQRFDKCASLNSDLQDFVAKSYSAHTGYRSLSNADILARLRGLSPILYGIIAETLFDLIPLLQPEDCGKRRPINFYFWPGYHSYLANRRIFIQREKDGQTWNLGVGLYKAAGDERIEHYDECSQARWYHYLVKPRNSSKIEPGDVHRWLLEQRPRSTNAPNRFISSLTVTIRPIDRTEAKLFPDHQVFPLIGHPNHTEQWGEFFSDGVNNMGIPKKKEWEFPDPVSGDSEKYLRSIRSKMQSIWLHSAFCNYKPGWLDEFIRGLRHTDEAARLARALKSAMDDEVACNWGDATTRRPLFTSWTNLSLHQWPAPTLPSMFKLLARIGVQSQASLGNLTAGSAAFLCSVPLRPRYLAVVRPWVSAVYGLIRNAEISILLCNREIEAANAGMLAGPYFEHEMKKLIDEGLSTTLRELSDTSPNAVKTRFFLYSLRTLGSLAYSVSNAVLSRNTNALEREKGKFLEPLRRLRMGGHLLGALRQVAKQYYESVWCGRGPSVSFPQREPTDLQQPILDDSQHASCFLLVAEMIRNYVEDGADSSPRAAKASPVAYWSASLKDNDLAISLTGPTVAQRNPASETFARLHVFLDTLGIGEASVGWEKNARTSTYTVKLSLL